MRSTILVLAVALMAGTTQVRADLVTYNMSGTVTSVQASDYSSFGVGDHITWTLQYNNSTPVSANDGGYPSPTTPLITNIVDQTTGAHFFVPSSADLAPWQIGVGSLDSQLGLNNSSLNKQTSYFSAGDWVNNIPVGESNYMAVLRLNINGPLPASSLASLQLNNLPVNWSTSSLNYSFAEDPMPGDVGDSFTASVTSISSPVYGAPEPGSLTLFLLGAAGLAARCLSRRSRFRLVSFLAVGVAG